VGAYGRPPHELMLALRDEFGVSRFVETGTFRGDTAAWAAERFGRVITIEASEQLHREAVERHAVLSNVEFVHGNTRAVLPDVVSRLEGPAVVWLDSHWSGGVTFGESDECPLLFEIETVRASPHDHYVFVDDARYFLAPPPRPHKLEHWPRLAQVTAALTSGERPLEPLLVGDVIVAVPAAAVPFVWQYAQDAATERAESLRERVAPTRRVRVLASRLAAVLRRPSTVIGTPKP
jgi:hypothetical protein